MAACSGTILSEEEEEKLVIAHENRWAIPPEVLAVGDTQSVPYTGAGPWVGSGSCSGGLLEGSRQLKDFIVESFPQVSMVGGYNCRAIVGASSVMSVHGTGRAIDIHIPLSGGGADNQAGDAIGNWLIANAEDIGLQYIIWDRTQWTANRAAGTKARKYNGSHSHNDHLHVELSVSGGAATTPWFSGPQDPPQTPACESVPTDGGIIDNDSLCLHLNGPSVYWRNVADAGHEGDLLWTNAFQGNSPSNWAQWETHFDSAGQYQVEVFLDPEYAMFASTEYEVRHAGTTTSVELDQSSGDGWTALGVFDFSAGGAQSVSVFDNTSSSPGTERKIMVDAIRVRPLLN